MVGGGGKLYLLTPFMGEAQRKNPKKMTFSGPRAVDHPEGNLEPDAAFPFKGGKAISNTVAEDRKKHNAYEANQSPGFNTNSVVWRGKGNRGMEGKKVGRTSWKKKEWEKKTVRHPREKESYSPTATRSLEKPRRTQAGLSNQQAQCVQRTKNKAYGGEGMGSGSGGGGKKLRWSRLGTRATNNDLGFGEFTLKTA